jgi:hypothetical protein
VFLSRPRRFGKTLLTSTLHYYFEGQKELFSGLAMERLEQEWIPYPVLHFDLGNVKNEEVQKVEDGLSRQLRQYEAIYGRDEESLSLSSRMADLIGQAMAKTGRKVVVLVDEYDAPILEVMHDDAKCAEVRKLIRDFFSSLKTCYQQLHFVFLTGISMFSQLSIFSELNTLEVISLTGDYASICGITERELRENFQYGLQQMAEHKGCSMDEIVARLKDAYDGYHFYKDSEGLFNPFSLLNALKYGELDSYWFRSGTPHFLVEMLRRYKMQGKFKLADLDQTQLVSVGKFEAPIELQTGPIPLLYQAGYLTIKGYDRDSSLYVLGIPNTEVRVGLLQNLLPLYAAVDSDDAESIAALTSVAFRNGQVDSAMLQLQSMLASIPFMKGDKDILADAEKTEAHYHIIFYFFFRMLHNEVYAEVRHALGATDVVVKTPKYIYVIEIKIDTKPEVALAQIEEKGYATPYLADGRQIVKLGVNFSTETRTVAAWEQA